MAYKRVKCSKEQLSLFVEKPYNWREILDLQGVSYDFAGTCIRSDGSAYGHPGTKCHKGVEGSPKEYEKAAKSGTLSGSAQKSAFQITKEAFEAVGGDASGYSEKIIDEWNAGKLEYIEKLRNGEVSEQEIIKAYSTIPKESFRDTEFLIVGMEPGQSENFKEAAKFGKDVTEGQVSLAKELSLARVAEKYNESDVRNAFILTSSTEILSKGKALKSSTFIDIASQQALRVKTGDPEAQLTGEQVLRGWAGGKVASVNMSGVPAFKTQYGNPGQTKVSGDVKKGTAKYEDQMDPNRSVYGYMAGKNGQYPKLTRSYFEKNVNPARGASVADAVVYAAEKGKLQGGYGAPGSGKHYKDFQNTVLRGFHEKGYKVYETEIMLGTGGKNNNKHVVHAVDLGNGKTFVSSDFSLNRPGYGAKVNNNPYKAYQAGRKLVETEKRNPGSAKVWEPKGAKPAKARMPKGSTAKPKATTSAPKPKAAPKKEEPKATTPKRSTTQQQKMDIRRRIQKAKREGRDADVAALESTLRAIK